MVVGNHLLKDESKTDSHSECEVTTAQNIQNKPKKEEESLGISGRIPKLFYQTDFIERPT